MNLEELRQICLSFPHVTEDIKWETHLCFNVGDKMFMITSPDTVPVSLSVKTDEQDFESLCDLPGIQPAPYLARYQWIQVTDIDLLSKKEWEILSRKGDYYWV